MKEILSLESKTTSAWYPVTVRGNDRLGITTAELSLVAITTLLKPSLPSFSFSDPHPPLCDEMSD